ncbi:CocE/NonD family hydrolase [Actinoalloteichus sp. GBA129-24]|uniref:CocE/NonD family hydrolase n=1 Tax=Actinoalloteichus sp. GBA129-24 TaxID=1612551 RepID=UPI000950B573|nr:CocE/NonD family hydrolase [Actinoalloteichus sp. GBA129-24]APU19248.1 putative acyl esterase [Actinoalloteichus sp. GBA129-24]
MTHLRSRFPTMMLSAAVVTSAALGSTALGPEALAAPTTPDPRTEVLAPDDSPASEQVATGRAADPVRTTGRGPHLDPVLVDGVTAPVYSYADAIRETVWVDLGMDLDRDGRNDRVAADVIRPAEPAALGEQIPSIVNVSPYFTCCGRGNEAQFKTYDSDGVPIGFPLYYDNYFVPRGYAVVLVDDTGSNRSSGCPDTGGEASISAGAAVVDWLNGRAAGFEAPFGGAEVTASWSGGAVGMIGKSADGAAANGAATTGVDGLRTVVPIGGVSSYYPIWNSHGTWSGYPQSSGPPDRLNPRAQVLCAPLTEELEELGGTDGDWNDFWIERDYTLAADQVRASVFAVHGFHDVNVAPSQFGRWWDALAEAGVERKAWLNQAGHVDGFDLDRAEFVATLHRWFDHHLFDVDNGIDTEPMIRIEHAPDEWADEADWPPASTRLHTLWPALGDGTGADSLVTTGPEPAAIRTFVDDPERSRHDRALDPEEQAGDRLVFLGEPLAEETRVSGTASVTVRVRSSTPLARVSAALVDYGPATIRDHAGPGQGIRTLETRSCWGEGTEADSACYLDTETTTTRVDHQIIASAAADVGRFESPRYRVPLRPDRSYSRTFELSTTDHVIPAGHRLALIIAGTDAADTILPGERPEMTLELAGTSVSIPVVQDWATGGGGTEGSRIEERDTGR